MSCTATDVSPTADATRFTLFEPYDLRLGPQVNRARLFDPADQIARHFSELSSSKWVSVRN